MTIKNRKTGLACQVALMGCAAVLSQSVQAANECAPVAVSPSDNGAAADHYECAGAYTAAGITYDSNGALTVNVASAINVGVHGVNLTGNGADSVGLTAAGAVTGTGGAVIDVTSGSGAINISTAALTGTNANVTHGIQAVSTGGGSVNVTTSGAINVTSAAGTAQQQSAIRAVSTGGNGDVRVDVTANVTGRLYGIQAQAVGSGELTISMARPTTAAATVSAAANVGIAAIDAVTGTGLMTVELKGGPNGGNAATLNGINGHAFRAAAGGDVLVNIHRNQNVLSSNVDVAGIIYVTAAGHATLNNNGEIRGLGSAPLDFMAVRAGGGSVTLNNMNILSGKIDVRAVAGAATFNNGSTGTWATRGTSHFGAGESTFNNTGILSIAGPTVFDGLGSFHNSRIIGFRRDETGNVNPRALSMHGTHFVGSGNSRLEMAAILGATGQSSCAVLTVADCLDLSGGSTSGTTSIILTAVGTVTQDANPDGIVLVDVSGGTSRAGDFIIDNRTANFAEDPVYGGMIRTGGWLGFALQYNEATQQHVLNTVVPTKKLEYLAAPQSVLSIWHTTSDSIAGRQADLRDRGEAGAWVRVTGGSASRDVGVAYTASGADYRIDDEYSLDTTTAIGGFDLAYGQLGGGDYVFGFHAGMVRASLERNNSPTTDEIEGTTLGVYGGWWGKTLTLDATINTNFLTLEHDRPVAEVSSTSVKSLGLRAEGGWRLPMGESFYVQPLASAAWVQADIKKVVQTSFEAQWQDVDSLRAALGLRLGGTAAVGNAKLGYWLTARAWNEFGGDSAVQITTPTEAVTMRNDLGGSFQEVGLGLNVSNQKDTLNVFASGNTQFASGMDDYSLSVGARLRW